MITIQNILTLFILFLNINIIYLYNDIKIIIAMMNHIIKISLEKFYTHDNILWN